MGISKQSRSVQTIPSWTLRTPVFDDNGNQLYVTNRIWVVYRGKRYDCELTGSEGEKVSFDYPLTAWRPGMTHLPDQVPREKVEIYLQEGITDDIADIA